MTHDHTPELPQIFPEDLVVRDEEHTYQTFEGENNEITERKEYTLDKAPISHIRKVTGTHNGARDFIFVKGTDYELTELVDDRSETFTFTTDLDRYELQTEADSGSTSITDNSGDTYTEGTEYDLITVDGIRNVIEWNDNVSTPDVREDFTVNYTTTFANSVIRWKSNDRPDAGTTFFVTYRSDSIISRYIEASDEEFKSVDDELNAIIESKFVDFASGDELDEMGKIFEELGKRGGRDDVEYRTYLKSVVQSFVSRGTKHGIKLAVAAATGLDLDEINIIEDFPNSTYEVELPAGAPVAGSTVEEIADIADPSGIELASTRFLAGEEEIEIEDAISVSIAPVVNEDVSINDTATVNGNKITVTETTFSNDGVTVSTSSSTSTTEWEPNDSGDPDLDWGFFDWV